VTGVIALFLVYTVATSIPTLIAAVRENQRILEFNQKILIEIKAQGDEGLRIARWTCAGVSKNDADRQECFRK
jgi:hypothetical protein